MREVTGLLQRLRISKASVIILISFNYRRFCFQMFYWTSCSMDFKLRLMLPLWDSRVKIWWAPIGFLHVANPDVVLVFVMVEADEDQVFDS